MVSRRRYRLKRHYKFEQDGRKYVADLETGDIIQINGCGMGDSVALCVSDAVPDRPKRLKE